MAATGPRRTFSAVNLYIGSGTDSIFLDLSGESPEGTRTIGDGVILHLDAAGHIAGIEVLDVSRRGGLLAEEMHADPRGLRVHFSVI